MKQKRCVYGMVDIGKQDIGTAPQTRTILTGVSDLCEWPVEMTLTFRLIPYRLTLCQCFSVSLNRFGLLRYYKHIQCQISGVLSAGYKHWKHFTWTEHLNEHKFDNISFNSLNVFVIENQIKFNLKSSFFFFLFRCHALMC